MLSMEVPSHHVVIDYFLITAYHQMFYSLLKLHKDSRLWKVMPVSKLTAPALLKAVRLRLYICPHSRYVMLHSFCIVTHFNWSPLLLVAVTSQDVAPSLQAQLKDAESFAHCTATVKLIGSGRQGTGHNDTSANQ